MSDRVAIYPGSFDPPTNGHLDILERSARLFDRVVIGVGRNLSKKTLFDAEQRIALMRDACAACRNVEVRAFDGLQVTFAKEVGASFIIRGIRALSDFEFEFEMGNMNRKLAPGDRDGLSHDRSGVALPLRIAREGARRVRCVGRRSCSEERREGAAGAHGAGRPAHRRDRIERLT